MNEPARTDLSISTAKANVYSLAFAIPFVFTLTLVYRMRWGTPAFKAGFDMLFSNFLFFILVFFLGTVVHEFIHGFSWMLFGSKPFNTIKFGFQLKTFTPYAHCKEPVKITPYRIGAAMPGILLGLLPSIIGILNGNAGLLAFGLLFTTAAAGDMLILWLIRNVSSDKFVEDHPYQVGCYILDDN
jgi:hypothetical protein